MQHRLAPDSTTDKPPVILLGGAENAVACARRFTRAGITTVVVNRHGAPALRSRRVVRQALDGDFSSEAIGRWLTGPGLEWRGAVLLPLSDVALMAMIASHAQYQASYLPALMRPDLVGAMLDKRRTVEMARAGGLSVPSQWVIGTATAPGDLPDDLVYPVILKPRRNLELLALTGRKYLRADDEGELLRLLPTMGRLDHGFIVNEFVPGGDDLLSSYNAIRSDDGRTLLEFTKRVDRRDPPNEGGATFHELIHLPETIEAGRRFFEHIGLVGFGNVEFKSDPRSGELRLIECNHRLTAATTLMQDHGVDVAGAVYEQALGRLVPMPSMETARGTMWYPIRDLRSFRRTGHGVRTWLRRPKRSSFPYFRLNDPGPAAAMWRRTAANYLRSRRGD